MTDKNGDVQRDILNIDEAAELLGVSVKTFNKVLHAEDMPARKIGREWKFSRKALIEWVGSGRSREFYREGNHAEEDHEITPVRAESSSIRANDRIADRSSDRATDRSTDRTPDRTPDRAMGDKPRGRRTAGWAIELD
jgi:excisionase family DNA binding protein